MQDSNQTFILKPPLLEVTHLHKTFQLNRQKIEVIRNLSLTIREGEIVGLGGESGCGKSTLGKLILRLIESTGGSIKLKGQELVGLSSKDLRKARHRIQMVFQNPAGSLNPLSSVEEILNEPFLVQTGKKGADLGALLEQVGLSGPFLKRYPHELSGGQKQRIAIARALALKHDLIVCDEPFSALDVSVQIQIIHLMKQLQQTLGLAYLVISHDLSILHTLTHRMAIMYLGQIVEMGPSQSLYTNPLHPYTQALLSAVPIPDPEKERQRKPIVLRGELPSLLKLPSGCPFHTRCPFAKAVCRNVVPELREIKPGHIVACHL